MNRSRGRVRDRFAAWLAFIAIVLQALASPLTYALAAPANGSSAADFPAFLGELCSIDHVAAAARLDVATQAATSQHAPSQREAPPAAGHCVFCPLPCGVDFMASTALDWNIERADATYRIASTPSEPYRAESVWPAHPARAPPSKPAKTLLAA